MQTLPEYIEYRQPDPAILSAVYRIARAPERDHLSLLVELMTGLQRFGVRIDEHWDCLLEAIVLEEIR